MLTNYLAYFIGKLPIIADYFNFLRDFFLALQIFLIFISLIILKKKGLFFYYLLIFLLAFFLTEFFKTYLPSARPISFYFSDSQRFDSFPSSHTTISVALSLALITQHFRYGILSLILTFLIALFSWFSLRHWPIDIFFGFVFGLVVFLIGREILYFFNRLYFQKFPKKS